MSLIKVNKNKNPYDVISNYIEKHVSAIDDIIAVISINGEIHNELFLIENSFTNSFIWGNDWWEGEENIELIDFFFVSDACKKYNDNDLINRRAAIDAAIEAADDWDGGCNIGRQKRIENYINKLPPIQPEIVRCKDCKHFVREDIEEYTPYGYNTHFHAFCDKHWDGEQGEYIDVNLDDFCSQAVRREATT